MAYEAAQDRVGLDVRLLDLHNRFDTEPRQAMGAHSTVRSVGKHVADSCKAADDGKYGQAAERNPAVIRF